MHSKLLMMNPVPSGATSKRLRLADPELTICQCIRSHFAKTSAVQSSHNQSLRVLTDQRLPGGEIQVEVLDASTILRGVAGQQDHCVLCLDRHKAQGKHIPAATVVTLENSIPKRTVLV